MSIQKQFLKSKPECKVTFSVAFNQAETVQVAGAFNNWSAEKLPLKKLKNGTFKGSINLPVNSKYEFKYLVNNESWVNDEAADNYIWNEFAGSDNGMLEL